MQRHDDLCGNLISDSNASGVATVRIQDKQSQVVYTARLLIRSKMALYRMPPISSALLLAVLTIFAPDVSAQQVAMLPIENVRFDYAQVLSVEPVYSVVSKFAFEQQCNPIVGGDLAVVGEEATDNLGVGAKPESSSARMINSTGNVFSSKKESVLPAESNTSLLDVTRNAFGQNCRTVAVERKVEEPVAYDVDYVYKGIKYRSRLSDDPGNNLRIRVSVTPSASEPQRLASP